MSQNVISTAQGRVLGLNSCRNSETVYVL